MRNKIKYMFVVIKKSFKEEKQFRFNHVFLLSGECIKILLDYFIFYFLLVNTSNNFLEKRYIFPYTILMTAINLVIVRDNDLYFSQDYKDGSLSLYLTQPHNFLITYFSKSLGKSLYNFIYIFFPIYIFSMFIIKQFNFVGLLCSIFMLLLSCLLMFIIEFIFAIFTIKLINNWGLNMLKTLIFNLFSGHLFPLFILPNQILNIFKIFPFYILEYPIVFALLNKLSIVLIGKTILLQLIWFLLLSFLLNKILKKLKRHIVINGG